MPLSGPAGGPPRVLVVDDEPAIRRLLVRFLGRKGCQVEAAADGSEALGALRERAFDVVVCDVTMPELDGTSLWLAARGDASRAVPPFVFVSALPPSLPRADAARIRFLAKPFSLEELWGEVRAVLGRP